MISIKIALNYIYGKNIEEIRKFTYNRILGKDHNLCDGENNEDVIIRLLENSKIIGKEKRKSIIDGCVDVYSEIIEWINDLDCEKNINKWKDVVISLCRIVDIIGPHELKKYAKQLLIIFFEKEFCKKELLGATLRAYMSYANNENIQFWKNKVLRNKDTAAYGYNALLDIGVSCSFLEKYICELWYCKIKDDWPVDVLFLMEHTSLVRNNPDFINNVLLRLKNEKLFLWRKVNEFFQQKKKRSIINRKGNKNNMEKMQYNVCETCGAKDGRAGLLIKTKGTNLSECINCHDTRERKEVVIHMRLSRTEEEIKKTMAILDRKNNL